MKKFSILVFDDQVESRNSLEEILISNEFLVKTATNGKEVFHLLAEDMFDLIIINTGMSLPDSFSTCRTIKENADWKSIAVIYLVDYTDLAFVKDFYESGGDDFILKPVVWSELKMKTAIHLELKYSRQMAKNMNQMLETKVAQRTRELEDSLKKLSKANKDLEILEIAKSEFFNLISHEIRTPLNGIMGSMALIDRYNLSDQVNRYFSLLDLSVKRLEKFSNTILEASTLRIKGEKALMFSESDLADIVQYALDHAIDQFSDKDFEIDFKNNSSNSKLKCDQKYLIKCFSSIFENALKFSPKGEKIEITIKNESDCYLGITIADLGIGFSKAALENIYSAMSNLDAHFDQNTGMGLHIAKLIIDAHSGFIKVGNRDPKGAIVEIKIPTGN